MFDFQHRNRKRGTGPTTTSQLALQKQFNLRKEFALQVGCTANCTSVCVDLSMNLHRTVSSTLRLHDSAEDERRHRILGQKAQPKPLATRFATRIQTLRLKVHKKPDARTPVRHQNEDWRLQLSPAGRRSCPAKNSPWHARKAVCPHFRISSKSPSLTKLESPRTSARN